MHDNLDPSSFPGRGVHRQICKNVRLMESDRP